VFEQTKTAPYIPIVKTRGFTALLIIQPIDKKKFEQKMLQDKSEQLRNNLKIHEQADQSKVK